MSNDTQNMTAEATAQAPASGLTTQSSEWDFAAEQLPNKDLHVQVTEPLYDKQAKPVTFLKPEKGDVDGKGLTVRLPFTVDAEITSVEGIKKAPGTVIRGRPCVLVPVSSAEADVKAAERGCRDVLRVLINLKLLKDNATLKDIVKAIPQVEGKKAFCQFTTTNGSKRDPETGQFVKFQNYRFSLQAPKEEAGQAAGSADEQPYQGE